METNVEELTEAGAYMTLAELEGALELGDDEGLFEQLPKEAETKKVNLAVDTVVAWCCCLGYMQPCFATIAALPAMR